jgi:hypothetical protein
LHEISAAARRSSRRFGGLRRSLPRVGCLLVVAALGAALATQAGGQGGRRTDTTIPSPDPPPTVKHRPDPAPPKPGVKAKPKPAPRRARVVTPPPSPPPTPPPAVAPPPPPPAVVVAPPPPPPVQPPVRRVRHVAVKRKVHVRRHRTRAERPAPVRVHDLLARDDVSLASAGPAGTTGSGSSALSILLGLLVAGSLLLVAAAVAPLRVLPPAVGAPIARHRADLATAGITGALCLLFAFLIAHVG